jgi:hypothetical protein
VQFEDDKKLYLRIDQVVEEVKEVGNG